MPAAVAGSGDRSVPGEAWMNWSTGRRGNPRRRGEFASAPRPDLILVDLNLPRKAGHEVLAEVKSDADLQRIPVVILTTSDAEEDILRSYDLHANAYVTKPVDFDRFLGVV